MTATPADAPRGHLLVVGVGVEPGTRPEHLRAAVDDALARAATDLGDPAAAVGVVATWDRRRDEPALLGLLTAGRTLRLYPVGELDAVDVPHPSAVVRRLTGTGSVAEAAALLAAREVGRGLLVVPKQRGEGVTVAVAR